MILKVGDFLIAVSLKKGFVDSCSKVKEGNFPLKVKR